MQRSKPLEFPVRSDPEVALDLPELDDECAQIMDRFEAARQSEDRRFSDRLQPGLTELKRRLAKAQATLPAGSVQAREAVAFPNLAQFRSRRYTRGMPTHTNVQRPPN